MKTQVAHNKPLAFLLKAKSFPFLKSYQPPLYYTPYTLHPTPAAPLPQNQPFPTN